MDSVSGLLGIHRCWRLVLSASRSVYSSFRRYSVFQHGGAPRWRPALSGGIHAIALSQANLGLSSRATDRYCVSS